MSEASANKVPVWERAASWSKRVWEVLSSAIRFETPWYNPKNLVPALLWVIFGLVVVVAWCAAMVVALGLWALGVLIAVAATLALAFGVMAIFHELHERTIDSYDKIITGCVAEGLSTEMCSCAGAELDRRTSMADEMRLGMYSKEFDPNNLEDFIPKNDEGKGGEALSRFETNGSAAVAICLLR